MARPATGAGTLVGAVIGFPVRHSLSPAIYNAAFDTAALDWVYTAFEVAPGSAAQALAAMKTLGIRTFAVTMPHKDDVFAAVDVVEAEAKALRSVNCVVALADGRLLGASTDGLGYIDSLRRDAGCDPSGARVAVLGAGGAARSIVDALARGGAADIAVINRTVSKAAAAAELSPVARIGSLDDVEAADIVVNATSIGMRGVGDLPCPSSLLHEGQIVSDIVYQPLETAFLRAAADRGARAHDGLGMLVHQAVHQYRRFIGDDPDPSVMRAAAEAELRRRASLSPSS